ncbi:hypothetical protein AV521_10085 [Streptomyces sp. IMTB 2501]|uniref:hypothetical protein n=1 Tax=Streptomyces sp. IMTB 2501 TaxID=1776340 RepID=UPI00096D2345|nr:hypothetical protein [Streptomyces sp. IMTB 2501]OLZ72239.1 hypothetical protein AV521_10085 [Streptomyces sp. IMTB 2501]
MRPARNHPTPPHIPHRRGEDALLADLFREAWHCRDESALPSAWDLFDAAAIRRVGRPAPIDRHS